MLQNLIKLSVGTVDIADKHNWQSQNRFDYYGQSATCAWTKHRPKQFAEIVKEGASIYWVIKGHILCRQAILGFEPVNEGLEDACWQIVLDAQLFRTIAVPRKAFQGWRYLPANQAPADRGRYYPGEDEGEGTLSPQMATELREIGLL